MNESILVFLQTGDSTSGFSETLGALGIRNEGFQDPREFLNRLKQGDPFVCVIDLTYGDTATLLAILKSMRSTLGPRLPIIALVPKGDKNAEAKARASGVSDTVEKPFEEDRLIATLAKYLVAARADEVNLPPSVKWCFEKISPVMAGIESSLKKHEEIEAQVAHYADQLAPLRDPFIAMVGALRKNEAKADLVQSIRMYGIRKTKNLIVAAKLSELTGSELFQWHPKTGMPTHDPAKILHYATSAVDHFGEDSRYQEVAFNAGLVLDLLSVLAEAAAERKAVLRRFIQERYEAAIRQIDKCFAAGVDARSLVLERHIITTLLMREAGTAVMNLVYPDYLELKLRMERKLTPPSFQHVVEMKKYSVSHNLLGALISEGVPGLAEAAEAVLFFDYPYMVKDLAGEQDTHDLIRVCHEA